MNHRLRFGIGGLLVVVLTLGLWASVDKKSTLPHVGLKNLDKIERVAQ